MDYGTQNARRIRGWIRGLRFAGGCRLRQACWANIRAFGMLVLAGFALVVGYGVAAVAQSNAPNNQTGLIYEQPNTLLMIDASGSMWGPFPGAESKLVAMRSAVSDTIAQWKYDASSLGIAAYGHRREGDCQDTEVILQASVNAQELTRNVQRLKGVGRTAIATALERSARQMITAPSPSHIVLIADGPENCERDVCQAVDSFKDQDNLDVHVIAMAMNDQDAGSLRCIANSTGGSFLRADTTLELRTALLRIQSLIETKQVTQGVQPLTLDIGGQSLPLGPSELVDPSQFGLTEGQVSALNSVRQSTQAEVNETEAGLQTSTENLQTRSQVSVLDTTALTATDLPPLPQTSNSLTPSAIDTAIQERLEAERRLEQRLAELEQSYVQRDEKLREQMRRTMEEVSRQLERERNARLRLSDLTQVQEQTIRDQNDLLAQLRDTLAEETDKKVRLASELANERLQLRRSLDTLQEMQRANENLGDSIRLAEGEIQDMRNQLTQLNQAKQDVEQDTQQTQRRYDELERVLELALTELEAMKNDRDDLQRRMANLTQEEASAQRNARDLKETQASLTEERKRSNSLQLAVVQAQSQIAALKSQNIALENRSLSLSNRLQQLQTDTSTSTAELTRTRQALAEIRSQLSITKNQLETETSRRARAEKDLESAVTQLESSRRQIDGLRRDASNTRAQLNSQSQRISALEQLLQNAEAGRQGAVTARRKLERQNTALNFVLGDVTEQLNNFENTLACQTIGRRDGRVVCLEP